MRQCKFYDKKDKAIHGGIIDDSGNVICGCCGGLIESNEIGDNDDRAYKIITVYSNWIDLDEGICGDDLFDEEDCDEE